MSVNATPLVQVTLAAAYLGASSFGPIQSGGLPLYCPNGVDGQVATLPASTSGLALAFPAGVTTSVFIFIAADTTTDLIITVKGQVLPVLPQGQGMIFYGLTSANISLASALGGQIRYTVGG